MDTENTVAYYCSNRKAVEGVDEGLPGFDCESSFA